MGTQAPQASGSLAQRVAAQLHAAMPEAGREALTIAELAAALAPPPKREMGDYAFPCFKLAKPLRSAPPKIAAELAESLQSRIDDGAAAPIASVSLAGPYLNVKLDLGAAADVVLPAWCEGESPTPPARGAEHPQRVMVEYSQPNTHKAFHVGHLRNVCLGDSLVRLYRAAGYEVVAANYLGDVGTHIAKCLWCYLYVLTDAERQPPAEGRGEWLGQVYARAADALAALESAAKEGDAKAEAELADARAKMTEILRGIEEREPEMTELWQRTRQWSLDEFEEIYQWCGVHFDRIFYESEVDQPGLELVEEYLQKGVFHESEGAVGVVNDEIKHMPFFMLRKRDGTGLYSTKDLALARMKFEQYAIDRSIYVVDVRQSDHFKHVFATLKKMGFEQAERCEHVPYEMVELPSGAMSSRKGTVVLFRALREEITAALRDGHFAKYKGEWSDEEIAEAAHQVALGAIKYGMLDRDVNQKIVFDMPVWLEFEGNTGPYLQYVTARTASILRKAEARGKGLSDELWSSPEQRRAAFDALTHDAERELVFAIAGLPAVAFAAAETSRPAPVCTYLFNLAKSYNRFQSHCNVIDSEGELLQARLLLVKATRAALAWGLDLLGIPAPERM